MKAIKIILAVAVVSLIGFFVWKWIVGIPPLPPLLPPTNQFTARIEGEIDSFENVPTNVFCQKLYNDTQYLITDYHKKDFLGNNVSNNNQWKGILTKDLYSAYAPKFAEQAMYVFKGSVWKIADIKIIRNEVRMLQISAYLKQDSPVASKFKEIDSILKKYDEIADFISSCNNFPYPPDGIGDHFPDVSDKIQKSHAYLKNNLDNPYVNNCTHLKDRLREAPRKLFDEHINYLRNKIQQNTEKYNKFKSQVHYSNEIYTPLKNQIDALDNEIYGVSDAAFNKANGGLNTLLSSDNRKAFDYFLSLKQQQL